MSWTQLYKSHLVYISHTFLMLFCPESSNALRCRCNSLKISYQQVSDNISVKLTFYARGSTLSVLNNWFIFTTLLDSIVKKISELFKQLLQTHSPLTKIATATFNAVEEFLVICSCKLIIVLLGTGGKQADTPSAVCHTSDCFKHVVQIHL
jgi:hypothetical protein